MHLNKQGDIQKTKTASKTTTLKLWDNTKESHYGFSPRCEILLKLYSLLYMYLLVLQANTQTQALAGAGTAAGTSATLVGAMDGQLRWLRLDASIGTPSSSPRKAPQEASGELELSFNKTEWNTLTEYIQYFTCIEF